MIKAREKKNKKSLALKNRKVIQKKIKRKKIKKVSSKIEHTLDLDKLAYAVAKAETNNCKAGFGKMYNNCFGIKNGNTVPCKRTGRLRMCIFNTPEESYKAFKKIWSTHYKRFPDHRLAMIWTGKDRARTWLYHVKYFYNKK